MGWHHDAWLQMGTMVVSDARCCASRVVMVMRVVARAGRAQHSGGG